MTERPYPAIGIDLGTTYTVAARLDNTGRPQTLINGEGDRLTPSVVLLEDEQVVVGKEAVKAMSSEMERVAECAKRDVGERMFHKSLGGRQYPPEAIEAWILNKVRLDAQQQVSTSEGSDYGSRLFRRGAAKGHPGCWLHGWFRGARYHQRANCRCHSVWLRTGVPDS